MMTTEERLAYTANQIARNLASISPDPVEATADHLASYWEPRMRARILAGDPQQLGLSEIATRAVQLLRERSDAKAG